VSSLLQLDIIPVIVVEGVPPDLKQDVMRKRLAAQGGRSCYRASATSPKKLTRKNFSSVNREVEKTSNGFILFFKNINFF